MNSHDSSPSIKIGAAGAVDSSRPPSFFLAYFGCRHETLLNEAKCREIWNLLESLDGVAGDVAELGVYRGGVGKLMALACPGRTVHLFDTFEGIPADGHRTGLDGHAPGEFAVNINEVRRYLSDCPNVVLHPGIFPATTRGLDILRFALVHLDADLYASIRAGLEWFWPRLSPGGAIVLDDFDWPWCPGVAKAVDEYFADKSGAGFRSIPYQLTVIKA